MPLVLGVDSSTQSTKVDVRDVDTGELVATGRAPHPPATPPRSEQDPASWWDALCRAVHEADVEQVDAVSVAAQQHGLVALDAAGEVIRPAKLWNDTESAREAAALVDRLGAEAWAEATGLVPVASFTITKLAWLADHEPEHLRRLRRALLPHDWLTYRLCGRYVTDRGDASGTGYFDPVTGQWRPDLLRLVDPARTPDDWTACLPTVLGARATAGTISASAGSDLRLSGPALVAPGTGDNMGAALGLGLQPGDVAVSIGTSGTVYTVSGAATADPTGAVAGFADATGRYLPLVCTLNATQVTDAFAQLLGLDRVAFEQAALGESAGADGVVVVPYLSGERTPNRPDATGTVTGLRTGVRPAQVARAAFEGVVCGLLDGLDALRAAGVPTDEGRMLLIGGGARSPAYRQIMADLAGRPVTIPAGDEHVATGACVQAAAALTDTPPLEVADAWGLGRGTEIGPDAEVDAEGIRAAYSTARG